MHICDSACVEGKERLAAAGSPSTLWVRGTALSGQAWQQASCLALRQLIVRRGFISQYLLRYFPRFLKHILLMPNNAFPLWHCIHVYNLFLLYSFPPLCSLTSSFGSPSRGRIHLTDGDQGWGNWLGQAPQPVENYSYKFWPPNIFTRLNSLRQELCRWRPHSRQQRPLKGAWRYFWRESIIFHACLLLLMAFLVSLQLFGLLLTLWLYS